ncbi:MAG TPA: metallophosphoesterase [Planctomycetota bacterium]|nr:metallophosphoesterase [Planctomycetota bacterium]
MMMRLSALLTLFLLGLLACSSGTNTAQCAVTRGPYLQLGTPTFVEVRWRTDVPVTGRVFYGTERGNLNLIKEEQSPTTEHSIYVTGLTPGTTYYYSIGDSSGARATPDDSTFTFRTAPPAGAAAPTRVWVIGDAGTGTSAQTRVRDAYLNFTGTRRTDVWLMLGDNAYHSGSDADFQRNLFDVYPMLLRNTVSWPTRGNHEVTDFDGSDYYAAFSLPSKGEAGGTASGTEKYYSFNHGNIHFVCLDSQGSDRSSTGPMASWLKLDLRANLLPWTIAYWHHPPYSKGTHDSDWELELMEMRTQIVPILEEYGVDLVLCGHSHNYERSFLLDGHYGDTTTFVPQHLKDSGSGRDSTPYRKSSLSPVSREGAVYVVAGTSGQTGYGEMNHPAMFIGLNELGSLVLDIHGDRLEAAFLGADGRKKDYFTLIKGTLAPPAPVHLNTATYNGGVNLVWTPAANTNTYNVYRATAGTGSFELLSSGVLSNMFTDASAINGVSYYYVVTALNSNGESAHSPQIRVTPPNDAEVVPPNGEQAMHISALLARLDFKKETSDSLFMRGEVSTGSAITLQNQTLAFDIGGARETFVLDRRGSGRSAGGACVARVARARSTGSPLLRFNVRLKSVDLRSRWSEEGAVNSMHQNVPLSLLVTLSRNEHQHATVITGKYLKRSGNTARFLFVQKKNPAYWPGS